MLLFHCVQNVPRGDWYCPDCKPKELVRTPLKRRKSSVFEEEKDDSFSSSSCDEDSSEEEEEVSDDEQEEEQDSSTAESDSDDSDESDDRCVYTSESCSGSHRKRLLYILKSPLSPRNQINCDKKWISVICACQNLCSAVISRPRGIFQ